MSPPVPGEPSERYRKARARPANITHYRHPQVQGQPAACGIVPVLASSDPATVDCETCRASLSEQPWPFSEAAQDAAAEAVHARRQPRNDARGDSRVALAAAVDADSRLKALLKLAALSDEEVVERVARAEVASRYGIAMPARATDEDREVARAVLAALGLPVAEQTER